MATTDREDLAENQTLRMAVDIVTAYLSNNPLPAATIPDLIATVHGALANCVYEIDEAFARPSSDSTPKPITPLMNEAAADLNCVHTDVPFNDFAGVPFRSVFRTQSLMRVYDAA